MSAARKLRAAIDRSAQGRPKPITDEFAQAVARKLESRGIVRVPGLPADAQQPEWFDVAIEHQRRQQELLEQTKARRHAEQLAQEPKRTTATILAAAIAAQANSSRPSRHLALNGAAVLRAALNGEAGTVNGEPS